MRVVALTGGIASGKSSVARLFENLGAVIIDADALARQVVEPGEPALAEIEAAFGPEMIDPSGHLDRKRLAARIFHDAEARRRLNEIVHPRVRERMRTALADLERTRPDAVVVLDIPLLFESPPPDFVTRDVIVVYAAPDVQLARLMAREACGRSDAEARLRAQRPLAEKLEHARWIVRNDGPLDRTREQVERIWREVSRDAASRRGSSPA
jgi:dephospho-CoA kinase